MEINLRNSTIDPMLALCKKHKQGNLKREELENLLEHEDYQLELDRYNKEGGPRGGFTKEEFVDFFMNFFELNPEEIQNVRLKMRYSYLKELFDNLDYFCKQAELVKTITKGHVLKTLQYTQFGLPENIKLERLDIIFSLGLGPSGGWFYNNASQYDLIHFFKDFDRDRLLHVIAHESHHIGMGKLYGGIDEARITPEEYLYIFLSGEGLAIKYCNNAEGVLTKKIYNDASNIAYDEYTMEYLRNDFMETFKRFKEQIEMCRNGQIKTVTELAPYLAEYWMNLHTHQQDKNEVPKLSASRNYTFGCEIWGLIYDVFGNWKVFELLNNPKEFPAAFNEALKEIGRTDLYI